MCYWYARETVTWDRARQKCRDNNARLVKIPSSSKNRLIGDMIKTNIWIGLNDRVEAGKHTMGHRSNVKYWEGSSLNGERLVFLNALALAWTGLIKHSRVHLKFVQ